MRILHVYKDYYPPVRGGIENTINLLARGTLHACSVSVLVCSGSHEFKEEQLDGVQITRVPEWGRVSHAPVSPSFPYHLRRLASSSDIIHLHHPNPTGDISMLLAGIHTPTVMTYHSDIVRQKFSKWLFAPVQNITMSKCSAIMPTSQQYLESSPWLQKFRSKCTVVPLGIELHRFSETESIARRADEIRATLARPIILFVGKLRSYKGLHLLVRAMKDVPDAVCVIIGEGYEEEYLHALRNDLELGDRVKFAGELPEQELIAHYFAADIFCLPSHLRSEAFGLSQVEAMACGLPVVSARLATGVPFVNQNGKTGLSVEPGSYEALSVALNALLKDDSLRNQMGVAARERALKLFGADRMCREVISVYRQVLKKA